MDCSFEKQICDAAEFLHRAKISSVPRVVISAVDRTKRRVILKPKSSISNKIDVYSLDDNDPIDHSDAAIHLQLYRKFDSVGSIIFLNSYYISLFVQSRMSLKKIDIRGEKLVAGDIPCSAYVSSAEDADSVITDLYANISSDPAEIPAVIVPPIGAVLFGKNTTDAAEYAYILEKTAMFRYKISEFDLYDTEIFDSLNRFDLKRKIRSTASPV